MGVAGGTDSRAYRPSLGIPKGEDPDVLQCLLASTVDGAPTSLHVETPGPREAGAIGDHNAKGAGIVDAIGGLPLMELSRRDRRRRLPP